jgi:hypothetical protein
MTMATAKPSPETPPVELPKKKRTPAEVQRDRLSGRIRRLENERDDAVRQAIQQLRDNAEGELRNRIALKSAAITARFGERLAPLQAMLGALKAGEP